MSILFLRVTFTCSLETGSWPCTPSWPSRTVVYRRQRRLEGMGTWPVSHSSKGKQWWVPRLCIVFLVNICLSVKCWKCLFPLSLVAKVSQVCPVNLCFLVGLSPGLCKSQAVCLAQSPARSLAIQAFSGLKKTTRLVCLLLLDSYFFCVLLYLQIWQTEDSKPSVYGRNLSIKEGL